MQSNVGTADRIIRAVVGLTLIETGLYFANWWGAIGLLPLLTAALAYCPAYLPLNISTGKAEP